MYKNKYIFQIFHPFLAYPRPLLPRVDKFRGDYVTANSILYREERALRIGRIMDGTSQSICTNWTERLKPFGQRAIPPSPRWIRESIHSKSKWTIARGRQIVIYDVSGASRTGPYFAVLYLWFEKGKIRCFCCD